MEFEAEILKTRSPGGDSLETFNLQQATTWVGVRVAKPITLCDSGQRTCLNFLWGELTSIYFHGSWHGTDLLPLPPSPIATLEITSQGRICQQSRGIRLAIDSSTDLGMRLACACRARRVRNDNFSSTTYRD
jgi:hypothetical protein